VGTVFQLQPREGGGWSESVAYSFQFNGDDGGVPQYGGLIFDGAGNLYGTASEGGTYDGGVAFELSPNGHGGWTQTLLYSFGKNEDAYAPYGSLIRDSAGNLYGTAGYGGIHDWGAAFELSPNGSGGWTEKVLHSFNSNGVDGAVPYAAMVFDSQGNLYGTTEQGGLHGYGAAFELSPNGSGGWTEKVIRSFNYDGIDGAYPYAPLIIDRSGNLYGTTYLGGIHYEGAVFELSPNGSGGFNETILHSFNCDGVDACGPYGGLVFDAAGNLYGTTNAGGIHYDGAVFELSPNGSGGWTEKILHSFNCATEACAPVGGLSFDTAGNLYGTTQSGGVNNTGAVFELTPSGGGNFSETVLHNFGAPYGGDGNYPYGGLVLDGSSNLYGMTYLGGTINAGTVFEVTP